MKDKTILMIAHRLKTVQKADQILVLDGGHIAQKGTHDELAGQDGLYRDFLDARKEAAVGSWHKTAYIITANAKDDAAP